MRGRKEEKEGRSRTREPEEGRERDDERTNEWIRYRESEGLRDT